MVIGARTAVRYRKTRSLRRTADVGANMAAAMAAMCETCGESVARGAVTRGPLQRRVCPGRSRWRGARQLPGLALRAGRWGLLTPGFVAPAQGHKTRTRVGLGNRRAINVTPIEPMAALRSRAGARRSSQS